MDPQSQHQGGFEMPAPQPNADMIPSIPKNEAYPAAPEAQPLSGAVPLAASSATPPAMPPAFQPPTAVGTVPVASTASPSVADDLDLIEKEWVVKAKAIVAQTRTDPYAQNREMNKFKADYMKKRYNKDIKTEP